MNTSHALSGMPWYEHVSKGLKHMDFLDLYGVVAERALRIFAPLPPLASCLGDGFAVTAPILLKHRFFEDKRRLAQEHAP
ncbi:MAG: hypothetical protein ACRC7G_16360 [Beijerinckiaceae bacterium]